MTEMNPLFVHINDTKSMSVRSDARLNPYMIQEMNADKANVVTTHLGRNATNSWIFVGDIPEDLITQIRFYINHPDQISIEVMRTVINLFGFDEAFATTFEMRGVNRVEDTKTFGMCFWDAHNKFKLCVFKNNRQIQLSYTGNMQPNAQICDLVRV
jgi:hypothetical protein